MWCSGVASSPQSEVIRAILSEGGSCCGGPAPVPVSGSQETSTLCGHWMSGACSRRRDCHLIAPPCNFIRCFNRDKQGVPSK